MVAHWIAQQPQLVGATTTIRMEVWSTNAPHIGAVTQITENFVHHRIQSLSPRARPCQATARTIVLVTRIMNTLAPKSILIGMAILTSTSTAGLRFGTVDAPSIAVRIILALLPPTPVTECMT